MDLTPQTSLLSITSESIDFLIKSENLLSPTTELPNISSNYSFDTSSISSYGPSTSHSDLHPNSPYELTHQEPLEIPYPNFGKANIIRGPNSSQFILFESRTHPGHVFRFTYRSSLDIGDQYRCVECFKIYKKRECFYKLKRLLVKNGYFLTNPDDPDHPHFCLDDEGFEIIKIIPSSKVEEKNQNETKKEDTESMKQLEIDVKEATTNKIQIDPLPIVHNSNKSSIKPSNQQPSPITPNSISKHRLTRTSKQIAEILEDYGPAFMEKDSDEKIRLLYTDVKRDCHKFNFIQKHKFYDGAKTWYFICETCKIVADTYKIPFNFESIKVQDGRIMTDPDVPHVCIEYGQEISERTTNKRIAKEITVKSTFKERSSNRKKRKMVKFSSTNIQSKKPKTTACGVVKPMVRVKNEKPNPEEKYLPFPFPEKIKPCEKFTYLIDVAGFSEEDIQVEVDKGYVIIHAEKIHQRSDIEEIKKTITYRRKLPENIDKDTIEGEYMEERDKLIITARFTTTVPDEKRSVPIAKKKNS